MVLLIMTWQKIDNSFYYTHIVIKLDWAPGDGNMLLSKNTLGTT